ncbi:DNA cytosine methyltransferase [Brevundimonas diminuta]|uniref:DNA cytosine methyltransferase n=1 Tax=Brevundimonas diminuta TaxID=293 RepID=UPI002092F3A2|nr:DNA cytosine methyltransferase [Brevundimonas diminuta]
MAARPYNILGLCAGVGGLELGVRIARPGARGVCYLEREVPAAARLVARMQDGSLHPAPVWSDLTTFDGIPWRGVVDCLTSGDPCQPNSVAGKQRGKDDDRWLLDHVFRIIDEVRPHRVFRENVPGNAHGQLEAIVPALEGMGYRIAAGIFSARGAGASHLRERLFIMADRDGEHGDGSRIGGPGWGRQPADGCVDVGNAPRDGRGEGRPEPELRRGRPAAAGAGCAMGDAIGRGDGRDASEPRRRSVVGTASDGQAIEMSRWPTPAARDHKGSGQAITRSDGKSRMDMLDWKAERGFSLLPAPTTHAGSRSLDPRRISLRLWLMSMSRAPSSLKAWVRKVTRPKLNPSFVDWMHGWPSEWTDCEREVTGFRPWLLRSRGELSKLLSNTTGNGQLNLF